MSPSAAYEAPRLSKVNKTQLPQLQLQTNKLNRSPTEKSRLGLFNADPDSSRSRNSKSVSRTSKNAGGAFLGLQNALFNKNKKRDSVQLSQRVSPNRNYLDTKNVSVGHDGIIESPLGEAQGTYQSQSPWQSRTKIGFLNQPTTTKNHAMPTKLKNLVDWANTQSMSTNLSVTNFQVKTRNASIARDNSRLTLQNKKDQPAPPRSKTVLGAIYTQAPSQYDKSSRGPSGSQITHPEGE